MRLRALLALTTAFAALPAAVQTDRRVAEATGQDAPDTTPGQAQARTLNAGEVGVTARKREGSVRDVPVAPAPYSRTAHRLGARGGEPGHFPLQGRERPALLSDPTLALVQGVAAAVPLALFSVPVGLLVDRFHRVRLFLALALLWTAATLLTAYAPDAGTLFVARMMTDTGAPGALTAVLSLGADLCLPAQRGRAMLVMTLG